MRSSCTAGTMARLGLASATATSGREVTLADLVLRVRQRIRYEYDFGDLWEHEIRVEAKLLISAEN